MDIKYDFLFRTPSLTLIPSFTSLDRLLLHKLVTIPYKDR